MSLTTAVDEHGKKGILKLAQKVNGNDTLTFIGNENQLPPHIIKELKTYIYQNIWKYMDRIKNIKKKLNIN